MGLWIVVKLCCSAVSFNISDPWIIPLTLAKCAHHTLHVAPLPVLHLHVVVGAGTHAPAQTQFAPPGPVLRIFSVSATRFPNIFPRLWKVDPWPWGPMLCLGREFSATSSTRWPDIFAGLWKAGLWLWEQMRCMGREKGCMLRLILCSSGRPMLHVCCRPPREVMTRAQL